MLVAIVIAAIPLLIINCLGIQKRVQERSLKLLSTSLIFILLLQIVLGTQVREQVDEISKALQYQQRNLWIGRLDEIFLIHRSFSWLVLAGCLLLFWKGYQEPALQKKSLFILIVVIGTILLGVIMMYMGIPALAQPLHLLTACLLVLAIFNFRLKVK